MRLLLIQFFILFISGLVFPLQVIMERATVTEINPKYLHFGNASVTRFGRKSPYYLNIHGDLKQTWNNNMTIHIIFFEYLHNEYRRSFVEMHLKFCDAVNSDPYVGNMLARGGIKCPLPPGPVHLSNLTVEAAEFPNVWPFRKAKLEVHLDITDTSINMARLAVFITFVQKKKNR